MCHTNFDTKTLLQPLNMQNHQPAQMQAILILTGLLARVIDDLY